MTPTSFLRLQKAMNKGLVHSLDDFYTVARTILVKSERYFDSYDQIFAHHFKNASLEDPTSRGINGSRPRHAGRMAAESGRNG